MANKGVLLLLALASASLTVSPLAVDQQYGGVLCTTCVDLMSESLDILLNVVLNKEIIGTCEELCSHLPEQLEDDLCVLFCGYVGIRAFIEALEKADLDPIYYCQLIDQCSHTSGGEASTVGIGVEPQAGPVGTDFTIGFLFKVTQATGAGTILAEIVAPSGEPLEASSFNDGLKEGQYELKFNVHASEHDPDGFPLFVPGVASVRIHICEGECYSAHPWSVVLDTAISSFNITESNY